MNCPKCLKEATPDCVQFGSGTRYICEHCGKVFTDYGQASKLELEKLHEEHFQQAVTTGRYKPYRCKSGTYHGKLYHPDYRDVEIGTLAYRSDVDG